MDIETPVNPAVAFIALPVPAIISVAVSVITPVMMTVSIVISITISVSITAAVMITASVAMMIAVTSPVMIVVTVMITADEKPSTFVTLTSPLITGIIANNKVMRRLPVRALVTILMIMRRQLHEVNGMA